MPGLFDARIDAALQARDAAINNQRARKEHQDNLAREAAQREAETRASIDQKWAGDLKILADIVSSINQRPELGISARLEHGSGPKGQEATVILWHSGDTARLYKAHVSVSPSGDFRIMDNHIGDLDGFQKYGADGYAHWLGGVVESLIVPRPAP